MRIRAGFRVRIGTRVGVWIWIRVRIRVRIKVKVIFDLAASTGTDPLDETKRPSSQYRDNNSYEYSMSFKVSSTSPPKTTPFNQSYHERVQ